MPGGDDLPSVEPQAAPAAGLPLAASPDAFGAPIGQAVANTGLIATRIIADQEQQAKLAQTKANQIAASNAIYATKSADQDELHGEKGLFTTNPGIDAPKAFQQFLAARQDRVAQARENLPSEEARQSFDLHENEQKLMLHGQGNDWQHQQLKQADNQALATSGEVHYNDAMIAAGSADPTKRDEGVNAAIAKGSMDIISFGERNGWNQERTTLATQEYASHVSIGVLKSLVDSGDYQGAKAFHEQHADDLMGDDRSKASQMLKISGDQDEALQTARDIIGRERPTDEVPNLENDLAKLDGMGIKDAKVYKEARQELETHYDLANKAHVQHMSQLISAAGDAIDSPDNPNHVIPPSALVGMDFKTRLATEKYRDAVIKEGEPKTDPEVYGNIMQMLADTENLKRNIGDGSEGGTFDLNQHRGDLSPGAFKYFQGAISSAQKQVQARDEVYSQGKVSVDVTNRLFKENGLEIPRATEKDPKTEEIASQAKLQGLFLQQLHKKVAAIQLEKQRPALPDEIDEAANKLFATQTWVTHETVTPDTFMGPGPEQDVATTHVARTFELPGEDKRAYSVHDLKAKDVQELTEIARKHGIQSPSEKDLVRAYNLRNGLADADR